ncbi:hypothetical protein BpHYR1_052298, partial [Brachionus plicatilis]
MDTRSTKKTNFSVDFLISKSKEAPEDTSECNALKKIKKDQWHTEPDSHNSSPDSAPSITGLSPYDFLRANPHYMDSSYLKMTRSSSPQSASTTPPPPLSLQLGQPEQDAADSSKGHSVGASSSTWPVYGLVTTLPDSHTINAARAGDLPPIN